MTITIADLRATLGLDTRPLTRGVAEARAAATGLKGTFSGLGTQIGAAFTGAGSKIEALGKKSSVAQKAFSQLGLQSGVLGDALQGGVSSARVAGIAAIALAAKAGLDSFVHLADEVRHFKEISGASAQESSRFLSVMKQLNVNTDAGARGFFLLGKNVASHQKALEGLGIEVARDASGNANLTETTLNVADAFRQTEDPAKRARIAAAAFGRGGAALIPILERGRAGLQEFFAEAAKHHEILTDSDLDKALQFRVAMERMHEAVSGLGRELGSGLAPALTVVTELLTSAIGLADKLLLGPLGRILGKAADLAFGENRILTDKGKTNLTDALTGVSQLGKALDSLPGSAGGATDSISEFTTETGTAQDPITTLIDKLGGPGQLQSVLADLVARGLPRQLATQFSAMGPSILDALNELANGTDAQISQFVRIIEDSMPKAAKPIRVFAGTTLSQFNDWRQQLRSDFDFVNGALGDLAGKTKLSAADVLKAFDSQIRVQSRYRANFDELIKRNLPQGFLKQLADLGPKGAPLVDALATANKTQFKRIVDDWKRSAHDAPGIFQDIAKAFGIPITIPVKANTKPAEDKVAAFIKTLPGKERQIEINARINQFAPELTLPNISVQSMNVSAASVAIQTAKQHAAGGFAPFGQFALFGEQGPEIGIPRPGGFDIMTAAQTRALTSLRGPASNRSVTVVNNVYGATDPLATARAVGEATREIVRQELDADRSQVGRVGRMAR